MSEVCVLLEAFIVSTQFRELAELNFICALSDVQLGAIISILRSVGICIFGFSLFAPPPS